MTPTQVGTQGSTTAKTNSFVQQPVVMMFTDEHDDLIQNTISTPMLTASSVSEFPITGKCGRMRETGIASTYAIFPATFQTVYCRALVLSIQYFLLTHRHYRTVWIQPMAVISLCWVAVTHSATHGRVAIRHTCL